MDLKQIVESGSGNIHMVGICGFGMSGLAVLLKDRGFDVSGCDLSLNKIGDWLSSRDIDVIAGHDPSHITPDTIAVVRSTAVRLDDPEIVAALQQGIPVLQRGEVLASLLPGRKSIAVAGTHGKTTTACFITQLLKSADKAPSWCIGGDCDMLGGVAGIGAGNGLVVEADESDGTLALYSPNIAVLTNVEFDHAEHFDSVAEVEKCFSAFISNTGDKIIFCGDDELATALCRNAEKTRSYGFNDGVDLQAVDLQEQDGCQLFTLRRDGDHFCELTLPVSGKHNVLNALAAVAVALEMDVTADELQKGVRTMMLPARRLEQVVSGDIVVISDYAHHPTEVSAVIDAVSRMPHKRLRAVFQPHRYSRTLAMGHRFPQAFESVDELVLCPVFAASEDVVTGGMIQDLYAQFR